MGQAKCEVVAGALLVALVAACEAETGETAPTSEADGKADAADGPERHERVGVPLTRSAKIAGLDLDGDIAWNELLQVEAFIDDVLGRASVELALAPPSFDVELERFGLLVPVATEGEPQMVVVKLHPEDAGLELELWIDGAFVARLRSRDGARLRYTTGPTVPCEQLAPLLTMDVAAEALRQYAVLAKPEVCEVELASAGTTVSLAVIPYGLPESTPPVDPHPLTVEEESFIEEVVEAMRFSWEDVGGASTGLEGQRAACLGNALGARWSDLALHFYCQFELAPYRLCFTSAFLLDARVRSDRPLEDHVDRAFGVCFEGEEAMGDALERVPFVGEIESAKERLFGRDDRASRRMELFKTIVARPAGAFDPFIEQEILARFYGEQRPLRLLDARTTDGGWAWGPHQDWALDQFEGARQR